MVREGLGGRNLYGLCDERVKENASGILRR